ncbi:MAG TPA: integrase arm-type DNA-binding domain-containing protein [Rhizomicrobium sp.]
MTDLSCRSAKKQLSLRKLSDMGGLQLWIFPTGSKLWRLAYRFRGKQKLLALGRYPDTSLHDARAKRDEAKALVKEGIDPSEIRKQERIEREAAEATFDVVADEYLAKLRREGRAAATMTKLEWLLRFARPALGRMEVQTIRPADVLGVLRKVEAKGKYDTADTLRSVIGAVCRYAVATARAETDPTVPLRGALTTPKATPRPAITDAKAYGALLRAIDGFAGQDTTRNGLKLMALLFPRPGELRAAAWSEFNVEEAVWTIRASRMKMRREHRVPLASQALAVLKDQRKISGDGSFVFPSVRTLERPMSENTLNASLRRLGYANDEATAHGFRASASTLLNENGQWSADAIERQLAHVEGNQIRRAYARGEHWEERVRMMAWWANYLDGLKRVGTVEVMPLRSA